jgi:hypothetical protein
MRTLNIFFSAACMIVAAAAQPALPVTAFEVASIKPAAPLPLAASGWTIQPRPPGRGPLRPTPAQADRFSKPSRLWA